MEGRERTGSSAGRGFALAVPFILFFAGVFFLSMYLFQSAVEETAWFGLIVGENVPQEEGKTGIVNEAIAFTPGERPNVLVRVPSIGYGQQFAEMNVTMADGREWTLHNIPIYLGSDKAILKNGAGMSFGSAFPGEGGCTIIAAHVTRHFAQLEQTKVGSIIRIDTIYGPYTYRVTEYNADVDGTDRAYYLDADQDADLILYTCAPAKNHGKRRTKRCVLKCELIDGAEVTE